VAVDRSRVTIIAMRMWSRKGVQGIANVDKALAVQPTASVARCPARSCSPMHAVADARFSCAHLPLACNKLMTSAAG
jgi:hypothetical protein